MKKYAVVYIGLALILSTGVCTAQAPHEIAGFVLGKNINDYKQLIDMETDLPTRYLECIREVEIKKIDGFKSGLIGYGTCAEPKRIVRIKLKYADSSKKFYEKLLKRFKERFGEPAEWRGDPFHITINWKWSFTDKENNKISLRLQHNTKDVEEKLGNAVKLTMTSAIEAERLCFESKQSGARTHEKKKLSTRKPIDWDRFLPR